MTSEGGIAVFSFGESAGWIRNEADIILEMKPDWDGLDVGGGGTVIILYQEKDAMIDSDRPKGREAEILLLRQKPPWLDSPVTPLPLPTPRRRPSAELNTIIPLLTLDMISSEVWQLLPEKSEVFTSKIYFSHQLQMQPADVHYARVTGNVITVTMRLFTLLRGGEAL